MIDLMEAIENRHSVRQYTDQPIEPEKISAIAELIETCNREGDLAIRLITNEPKAFDSRMAHYGKFSGVTNYIVLIGQKAPDLEERCGYYGEKIVLLAQQLGLNTCWVGLTYSKQPQLLKMVNGEKVICVITLGYGITQGTPHKSKAPETLCRGTQPIPDWFKRGLKAAMLAPTAVNQQKFLLTLNGNRVSLKAGLGFFTKVDLGIVKYHFEIGAGTENFEWTV